MFRVYWEYEGDESRANPFQKLTYTESFYKDIPSFSDKWMREKIMKPGMFDKLKNEIGLLVLALIETGCRPSEIANGVLAYLDDGVINFKTPANIPKTVIAVSKRQLDSRIDTYTAERAVISEEKKYAFASSKSLRQEIYKLNQMLPLLERRVRTSKDLAAKGWTSRMEALRLEEELIARTSDFKIAQNRLGEATATIAAAGQRINLLSRQFRRDALSELAKAEAIIADRIEAEKKTAVRNEWQTLRAPVDGTVLALTVFTIGEVVEAGSPILVIAPKDAELKVEAMILNKDIGFVKEGDEVSIKIESFPFTRFGLVRGFWKLSPQTPLWTKIWGLFMPRKLV
ncbi:MAG: hypothetical protein COA43_08100 [Robiginitomaculum sp.]|nr:MAG: hypothetical protein COA43_08100 [Robiginitomaculum sp.]